MRPATSGDQLELQDTVRYELISKIRESRESRVTRRRSRRGTSCCEDLIRSDHRSVIYRAALGSAQLGAAPRRAVEARAEPFPRACVSVRGFRVWRIINTCDKYSPLGADCVSSRCSFFPRARRRAVFPSRISGETGGTEADSRASTRSRRDARWYMV